MPGIFRLSIVIVLLSWVIAAILTWKNLADGLWNLERHISVYSTEFSPYSNDWPVYSASPEFISLNLDDRLSAAETFYQSHVVKWKTIYYTESLERWILRTSQYNLNKAPRNCSYWNERMIYFRDYPSESVFVSPKLVYVLFNSNTLAIAGSLAIFIWAILMVMIWVIRGFMK
jgi:hypothetical protein